MTERNRELALRWFEDVWNQRRHETIHAMVAPNAPGHLEGQEIVGPDEFKLVADELIAALPDMKVTVEAVVADENQAAVRWRFQGTHTGTAMGLKPTGRKIFCHGMTWFVFRDGKIVEGWDRWNQQAFIQQLQPNLAA